MNADEYAHLIEAASRRAGATCERHPMRYRCGEYSMVRIAAGPDPAPILFLSAGIHGDEISGPLTLLHHLESIVADAIAAGLALRIYPLMNPSGFERRVRYNGDGDTGEGGNNDFLRYELDDGTLVAEIEPGAPFRRWRFSADVLPEERLPLETRTVQALLRREPLDRVVAALDLHQDVLAVGAPAAAYCYAMGDLAPFAPIARRIAQRVPLWRDVPISSGYELTVGAPDPHRTDALGFVVRHDGTLCDLFHRVGARWSATPETTGATPLDVACEVNLDWIRGFIALHRGS